MMKLKSSLFYFMAAVFFSACGNQFTLQKRHYRKGIYMAIHHHPEQKQGHIRTKKPHPLLTDNANYDRPGKNSGLSILAQPEANQMHWFDSTQKTSENQVNENTSRETKKIKKCFSRNAIKSGLSDKASVNNHNTKSFRSVLNHIIGFLFIFIGLLLIIVNVILLLYGGPFFDHVVLIVLMLMGLVVLIRGILILQ